MLAHRRKRMAVCCGITVIGIIIIGFTLTMWSWQYDMVLLVVLSVVIGCALFLVMYVIGM